MLNVMLVDDDYPVLEFLSQSVPWESLHMRVQGVFESGVKALDAAKVSAPDILITDIGMPHMNGLELIAKMKEDCPLLKVVILSCHDDFNYAQQAVKLHVNDYILKEKMEIEDIVQLLRKFADQLEETQTASRKVQRLQQITKESRLAIRSQFLQTLLYHPLLFPEQLTEQAREYGIELAHSGYLPVLCFIDRFVETHRRFVSKDNLIFAVENVMEELICESGGMVIFRPSPEHLLLLFPIKTAKLSTSGLNDAEETLRKIQLSLLQYLRVRVTFLIGQHGQDIQSLKERISGLLEGAEEARFYAGSGLITRYSRAAYTAEDLFTHYSTALEELKQVVLEQAADRVDAVTGKWTGVIIQERYHPRIVKEWFLKMMLDLQLKFKSLQHFQSGYSLEVLHQSILEAETIEQLREMIISLLHRTFSVMEHIYKQPQRKEIAEAQLYVLRSVNRRITQEEVAEYLHLNPSYFSRLFKRETGENFVEFVTRTKMEKAKELIDQTDVTVAELAELLGYDNKSYFLKCFKNYSGLTPGEYAGKVQRSTSGKAK
ncbi:response regulator [Paenibacillus lutrae]|uniref:Response regulator n=1 Tax=Paenibacillus lutrae TaxID=2078573 RepID=A0A7X3K0E6_9BACL|nr:helix-turn-helix domain-containing protein [Paenibacillus lutrae]MVP01015.1 response regulator [Paenibacillus lutrae]